MNHLYSRSRLDRSCLCIYTIHAGVDLGLLFFVVFLRHVNFIYFLFYF